MKTLTVLSALLLCSIFSFAQSQSQPNVDFDSVMVRTYLDTVVYPPALKVTRTITLPIFITDSVTIYVSKICYVDAEYVYKIVSDKKAPILIDVIPTAQCVFDTIRVAVSDTILYLKHKSLKTGVENHHEPDTALLLLPEVPKEEVVSKPEPNPVPSEVLINFDGYKEREVQLYDSRGNLIRREKTNDVKFRINTTTLAPGEYFLIIKAVDELIGERFVKN